MACEYCGHEHLTICDRIKTIEYYENGKVKSVTLKVPADYYAPYQPIYSPIEPRPYDPFSPITTTW